MKPLHYKKLCKIFEKFGCVYSHTQGDHKIYHFKDAKRAVVIPKYKDVVFNPLILEFLNP
ncbi:MAG: type II toxin-antitoxin system HicA family toxin [Candidatus Scalindua sp. SCAELEC01]|nr:MAG: type II toxin-antitoxin system HicA family toxin [Candidatus Scalindua sp.]NOG82930.1 type II toxin-antitoxin system HicA family toxin [Planctomycetota bacterium]RZV60271.1 MAG: type II toxin-antitoxin system HicA family toxin [Candidatus Scalindua sp. SCAELEC01]